MTSRIVDITLLEKKYGNELTAVNDIILHNQNNLRLNVLLSGNYQLLVVSMLVIKPQQLTIRGFIPAHRNLKP